MRRLGQALGLLRWGDYPFTLEKLQQNTLPPMTGC
jgi:hypothetical protein